jgi:NAD+ synthase
MSEGSSTPPALNLAAAADVLGRGLRREVERTGFTHVVLGLSGGLDSAVVAHLCCRAFGHDAVLALLLPHATSSPDSLAHAQLVASALGIAARVEPITAQVDAYFAGRPQAGALRRGNKMARERMSILYDVSAAERRLVIGTSNKTELLLGYSTLFGDSACAVMPIGDLYKTQVRLLASWLAVPQPVLDKPPSADLWAGQTDEGEMGFTYEEVDRLLYHLVDCRRRADDLPALGFSPELVSRVHGMIQRSQFKRKLPVILKLSARTVDKDFLYPRDWTG